MMILLCVLITAVIYLYLTFNQNQLFFNKFSQSSLVRYGLLFVLVVPIFLYFNGNHLDLHYKLWLCFINAAYLIWLWSKAHAQYHFFSSKAAEQTTEVQKWLSRVKTLTFFSQVCTVFYYFN